MERVTAPDERIRHLEAQVEALQAEVKRLRAALRTHEAIDAGRLPRLEIGV